MSNFVDGSGPILSMYLEMASEEDKKMPKAGMAEGILVFVRLYLLIPCLTSTHLP